MTLKFNSVSTIVQTDLLNLKEENIFNTNVLTKKKNL